LNDFSSLGLSTPILKALAAENYTQPTPIQLEAIPHILGGRDLLGLAQTGTGKTAAFVTPLLHRLAANRRHAGARGCRALILAPTRELAAQICDGVRAYGKYCGLSAQVIFGGVPIGRQINALQRGVDVLVATPGRLLDLVQQRALRLDGVEILVLDEADHMLDLGFIVPLRKIRAMLPRDRQSLLFSATMPDEIAKLAEEFLHEPVRVAVTPVASTPERVNQSLTHVQQSGKQALLHNLLKDPAITRALVFARTKHGADRIVAKLEEQHIEAYAIHGNKRQGQREKALAAFRSGKARLLVATDIAARGIDVDNVSHVINFDLPDVAEQYVHRIGRTARAGNGGIAISFCSPEETGQLRDIERLLKNKVPATNEPLRHERREAAPGRPHKPHHRKEGGKSRPHGERSQGERHQGERPSGERPQGKRPYGQQRRKFKARERA
jgi:ATP-dependent RNA helicase RhlE